MHHYGSTLHLHSLKISITDRVGFNGIYTKSEKSSKSLLKAHFDVLFKLQSPVISFRRGYEKAIDY